MATKRTFAVSYAKQDGEKTYWPQIGRAFENEKNIRVRLDALPVGPWDGTLYLFPQDAEAGAAKPATKKHGVPDVRKASAGGRGPAADDVEF